MNSKPCTGFLSRLNRTRRTAVRSLSFLLLAPAFALWAVDGVVEINHARAEAGGVTPGDTEGYPVTIDQPGSYRLTGNLNLPDENTSGVVIEADNVTLDLNGFSIIGPAVCMGFGRGVSCSVTGSGSGIIVSGNFAIVRNGTVSGAGDRGVKVFGRALVEGIQANRNGSHGIEGSTPGVFVDVKDCTVFGNLADGIFVTNAAFVSNNSASANSRAGIAVFDVGLLADNVTRGNGDSGIKVLEGAGIVRGNQSTSNIGFGLLGNPTVGYTENLFGGNTEGAVSAGIEMGTNLCNGDTTCP